jgi:hypothetical protein
MSQACVLTVQVAIQCSLKVLRLNSSQPVREVIKPDNQLHLTEAELGEEVAKMLTANNPVAPKNVARFNMKERTYKVRCKALQLWVVDKESFNSIACIRLKWDTL